jgi:hypothetical protein
VESQAISRVTATTETRNDEMDHRETNGNPEKIRMATEQQRRDEQEVPVGKRARAGEEGWTPAYSAHTRI